MVERRIEAPGVTGSSPVLTTICRGVLKRPKRAVSKTVRSRNRCVGSNPTPSAKIMKREWLLAKTSHLFVLLNANGSDAILSDLCINVWQKEWKEFFGESWIAAFEKDQEDV